MAADPSRILNATVNDHRPRIAYLRAASLHGNRTSAVCGSGLRRLPLERGPEKVDGRRKRPRGRISRR